MIGRCSTGTRSALWVALSLTCFCEGDLLARLATDSTFEIELAAFVFDPA